MSHTAFVKHVLLSGVIQPSVVSAPASAITYTVVANLPDGPVELDDMTPRNPRPQDADIRSAGPDDLCEIHEVAGELLLEIAEHFAIGDPCP